ncbi:general stress protein [Paenibacillus radicis (ex Gao et al. 2016)]|uniref:General stress protein 17M-like domain-containing protein n=1 Tax=Paenibacillus radicis (ex Gao et al. 2016) TaxID=1737354 RepID=A0A917HL15_9BACL|nr:general stress protein [Paenibacillus radicis (ex Gao et al. 2016)]GGG82490.1 hypothetical protein GCM10010918_44850 [Paenibacillus radicis (ex Gao et al. 2016)]
MAKKIAAFETQRQVIDTIAAMQQAGFETGELKIYAKDATHSRRIEAESDMHVDEIRELAETRENTSPYDRAGMTFAAPGILAGSGVSGTAGWNGIFGAAFIGDDAGVTQALMASGLDTKESDFCRNALENGQIIVVVETDESKSLLDKDGGPDLSKLGIAESVFRQYEAYRIIDGS